MVKEKVDMCLVLVIPGARSVDKVKRIYISTTCSVLEFWKFYSLNALVAKCFLFLDYILMSTFILITLWLSG